MNSFGVIGLQLEGKQGDNTALIEEQIALSMAIYPWAKMVLLSELAPFGISKDFADSMPGNTEKIFCDIAKKFGIWLVPGSLLESEDGKYYNSTPVISPEGEVITRYRKMFPWYPVEKDTTPGDSFCVFDIPNVGRFGISNCYDMWFPETTRALIHLGAEVILHPTMTNTSDRDLELVVARANAIMNQCYFIDINGAGELGCGLSIAVGPEGEIIHQAREKGTILPIRLDMDKVRQVREEGTTGVNVLLKSYRECKVKFPQHEEKSKYLDSLGPLVMRDL